MAGALRALIELQCCGQAFHGFSIPVVISHVNPRVSATSGFPLRIQNAAQNRKRP